MNSRDLAYEVSLTLADHAGDYNIPAIVEDIIEEYGPLDPDTTAKAFLDSIPSADYWEIARAYDSSE